MRRQIDQDRESDHQREYPQFGWQRSPRRSSEAKDPVDVVFGFRQPKRDWQNDPGDEGHQRQRSRIVSERRSEPDQRVRQHDVIQRQRAHESRAPAVEHVVRKAGETLSGHQCGEEAEVPEQFRAQNADGSWGPTETDNIYLNYHATLCAVSGLLDYAWRGTRLSFPRLQPLLERWARE